MARLWSILGRKTTFSVFVGIYRREEAVSGYFDPTHNST